MFSKTQLFRQDIPKWFFALNSPCKTVIENLKQFTYKKSIYENAILVLAPEVALRYMVSMLIFPNNRFFRHFDFIVFSTQIAPKKSNAIKIFFISGRKN